METAAQKPKNMLVAMIDESFQYLFMLYIILMKSNLKSKILYCFPTFTQFDSPWVYIYKRLKQNKKKGLQLKKPSDTERDGESPQSKVQTHPHFHLFCANPYTLISE